MTNMSSQYAQKVLADYDAMFERQTGFKFKHCKLCDAVIRLDNTCSNPDCEKHTEEV